MRLLRGRGIGRTGAMGAETERDGVAARAPSARDFKSSAHRDASCGRRRLADDPTNRDPAFTRPRLRALMPALAEEGPTQKPCRD